MSMTQASTWQMLSNAQQYSRVFGNAQLCLKHLPSIFQLRVQEMLKKFSQPCSANTVAAPLIAAASNQKIFSVQLAAASIQERPLIKK